MRTAGLAAAGAAALGASAGQSSPAKADASLDAQILNFALNLEYLEAQFYLMAIGKTLDSGDIDRVGTTGAVSGGRTVKFTDSLVSAYANEIAIHELYHVRYLGRQFGSAKVARPALKIGTAFAAAAQAAGLGDGFDAYASDDTSSSRPIYSKTSV